MDDDFLPATKVTSVSRVLMPPRGGQTIVMPRFMADVQTLWGPLRATELPDREGKEWPSGLWLEDSLAAAEKDAAQRYLHRLAGAYKRTTTAALQRSMQYLPVFVETLRRHNLPVELACLPLVESAFQTKAVSSAGAAGLWQLMPATARHYGLTVAPGRDDRFDTAKATEAAVSYLSYLYKHFGDWALALAAYNCGEGGLRRALKAGGCRTLAALLEKNRNAAPGARLLPDETAQYVPKFAAAVAAMQQSVGLGLSAVALLPEREVAPVPLAGAGQYDSLDKDARPDRDTQQESERVPPLSSSITWVEERAKPRMPAPPRSTRVDE